MHIGGTWSNINDREFKTTQPDYTHQGLNLYCGPFTSTQEDAKHFFIMEGQMFDATIQQAILNPIRLETAYGYYGYVWHDKINGEIRIGTDKFGYFPMYYAFENGIFIFGTSINFVKSRLKTKTPDYEAWEELLVLGEIIGEKSSVNQIKRLSEGTQIRIRNGNIRYVKYWQLEMPEPVDEASYIRENNRLLDEAMALTASQTMPKIVLLSGGEDSRRIALAAERVGLEVSFYTQENSYNRDRSNYVDADFKLAKRLSEMLNRPHFSEPMANNAQYLQDWKARDSLLGFECIAHEWLLPLARRISPPSLIYDGIVGDVTINGHYLKSLPRQTLDHYKDIDATARLICGNETVAWLDNLRQRTASSLFERVRLSLSQYPESPHRVNLFSIFNHNRRKIACVAQMFGSYGHTTCYPFLYYPLFVQSLSLDPKLQINKHYQRECMAALSPEIVSIPTTRQIPMPDEWLIPRDDLIERQADYLLRNLHISKEAFELFPTMQKRFWVLNNYRKLTNVSFSKLLNPPLHRWSWFISPIARFSNFLKWLDS